MSSRFPEGYYKARAVSSQLGTTSKGTAQIAVEFELIDEAWNGQRITWFGFFSEKTKERTLESLRHCGWTDDDLAVDPLPGFGSVEVSLSIADEEYNGEVNSRVKWVNKAGGGGVELKSPMNDAQKKAFAASMKGSAIASRQATPAAKPAPAPKKSREPGEDDDELGF